MPRSTKAASDRRLEFINAAEALFTEKGFENTSIDDIVQRVGVAKGLFYYYFKSREELLANIVDQSRMTWRRWCSMLPTRRA